MKQALTDEIMPGNLDNSLAHTNAIVVFRTKGLLLHDREAKIFTLPFVIHFILRRIPRNLYSAGASAPKELFVFRVELVLTSASEYIISTVCAIICGRR